MKIFLFGHYHTKNFGDKLLRDILIDFFHASGFNDVKSVGYDEWRRLSRFGKVLFILLQPIKSDVLVLGGGGYLNSNKNSFGWFKLFRYLLPILVAKIFRRKVLICGVGVGPDLYGFGRQIVRLICKLSDYLSVRDTESVELLLRIGVKSKIHVFSDLAMSKYEDQRSTNTPLKIAFHLILRNGEASELEEMVSTILSKYKDSAKFYFLSDNGLLGDEKAQYSHLIAKYNIEIFEDKDTYDVLGFIQTMDVIVTTKLHVSILGAFNNKLMFSVARNGKTMRFFKQIEKSGNCIPLASLTTIILENWLDEISKYIEEPKNYYNKPVLTGLSDKSYESMDCLVKELRSI